MNKFIIVFLGIILLGCHRNEKHNSLKKIIWKDHSIEEKDVKIEVRRLIDSNKSAQAIELLNTLINSNKQNGYLYFEKGFVEEYNFRYDSAEKEFKIAEALHYDTSKIQFMRKLMQHIKNGKFK